MTETKDHESVLKDKAKLGEFFERLPSDARSTQFQSEGGKKATWVAKYTAEMQDGRQVLEDDAKLEEFYDHLPAEVRSTDWHVTHVEDDIPNTTCTIDEAAARSAQLKAQVKELEA